MTRRKIRRLALGLVLPGGRWASSLGLLAFAAAFCLLPPDVLAQTLQWDGSLTGAGYSDLSGNWDSTTADWYNPLLPGDQDWVAGDTADFGSGSGSGTYTITFDNGNIAASGLVFNTDPGGFTFAGTSTPTLTLGTGGISITSGAGAENFGSTLNIALSAGQTWTNGSSNTLTVNSGITSSAVGGTQTLNFAGAGNTTIAGVIGNGATGGTLALTMNGAGTLALNGANTFSGLLRINSGIVATNNLTTVGAAQGIGEASTLALNGGTFEYNGGTGTYEQNNANAGSTLAISAGPNGGALWNNSAANYFAYDGVLSGAGNLTFLSSTTATNAANNSQWFIEASSPDFTGNFVVGNGTTVANIQYRSSAATAFGTGTIVINNLGLLAADAGATTPTAVANNIILNGGILSSQSALTYSGAVTLNSGTTSTIGNAGNSATITVSGVVSGAGNLTSGFNGNSGTNFFTNTDTYSGSTSIASGTLALGNGGALGSIPNSSSISISSGAKLEFDRGSLVQEGIDFSAQITGSGSIVEAGFGPLVLNAANSFAVGITVTGGTLRINNAAALGTGTLTLSGGTIDNTSGNPLTLSTNNAQSWTGNFAFGGTNALNLGAGAVTLGANVTVSTSGSNALTVGGAISGSDTLAAGGNGTLVLSGASTYSGTTFAANGGTLSLTGSVSSGSALALGGGTFSYVPTAGGGTGNTQAVTGLTVNSGGSSLTVSSGNTVNLNGITRNAGGTVNFSTTGTIDTTDTVGDGTGLLGDWATYGGTSYAAPPATSGGAITAYTGATTATAVNITSATTNYSVPSGSSLGTLANSSTGNTLAFVGSASSSFTPSSTGGLTLNGILSADSGNVLINSGGGSLVIGANKELVITGNAPLTINSVIAPNSGGTSSVTYSGTGTLTLGGANTFTGGLVINSGTVAVGNMANSGTAQGIGEGSVTLNGGTLENTNTSGTGSGNYDNANTGFTWGIAVGTAGGTIYNAGATNTYLSLDGPITGSGPLTILSTPAGNGPANNNSQVFFEYASTGFSGPVIIGSASGTAGVVQLRSSAANLLGTGTVTINSNGLLSCDNGATGPTTLGNNIIMNGGYLGTQAATMNFTGAVLLNISSSIGGLNASAGSITMSGPISGPGGLTIGHATGDTVYFNNIESYTGATTVSIGTLQVGNGAAASLASSGISIASGATLAFDIPASTTETYSGPISSSGAIIVRTGTGTQVLSGTNASTLGTTTVSAGTLEFVNEVSLYDDTTSKWTASNIIVASGGTLAFEVGGSGQFTASDLGTILSMASSGTAGFETGSAIGIDTTGGSFIYNSAIANGYSGGTLGLTVLGPNTLTLGGTNTYTGATTVSAGTLVVSSTGSLASGSSLSIASGATATFQNATQSLAGLSGNGTLNLSGSGGTALTIGGSGTFNGPITGSTSSLTISSGATPTFTNPTTTYGGGTTINGTLTISTGLSGNYGATSQLGSGAVSLGSGGVLDLAGPTSVATVGLPLTMALAGLNSTSGNGTVNLTNLANLQIGLSGMSSSYGGAFTGAATNETITITGGGTFTLTGSSASTFTTPITVSSGTLRVTNTSGSATGGAPVIVGDLSTGNPATLSGTGIIGSAVTINGPLAGGGSGGTIAGASGGTLTLSGGLTLATGSIGSFSLGTPNGTSNPATTALIATSIGTGNSLTISGLSTIAFTTPQVGTYDLFSYTGGAPNVGNLQLNAASEAASPSDTFLLVNNASQSQIDLVVAGPPIFWTGSNTSWDTNTSDTTAWVNGSGTPSYFSNGEVVTFGDTYPPNSTSVGTGTISVVVQQGGVSPTAVTFNNSLVNYSFSNANGDSAGISGPAIITKSGAGTVTFTSPNTFSGSVSITGGELSLQNAGALGSSSGVSVGSGAALQLQGGFNFAAVPLTISGTGLAATPAGALQSYSGANTYGGQISIGAGGATITSSSTAPGDGLTLTGGIATSGNAVTINGPGNTTVNTTAISGTGSLAYTGGGLLTLNAASTYSGGTSISSGTVRLGVSTSVSGSSPNETLVSGPLGIGAVALTGGTLQDNGTATTLANSFSVGGTVTLSSAATGSLTLDGTGLSTPATVALSSNATLVVNNSTTINDVISGSGYGINTSGGTGTLILGGANTFSGRTTINPSSSSSVVQLNNSNALQDSVVTINDPSGIVFNAGIGGVAFGGLAGSANLTMQDTASGAVALTLGNSLGNNATYSGNLTGAALAKLGTNTQTLSGSNSFASIGVSSGTLAAATTAALGTAPITLSGGTLALQAPGTGTSPSQQTLAATGFNAGVIAAATATSASAGTTGTFDGGNVWFQQGFLGIPNQYGLNVASGGTFTSAANSSVQFKFQSFTANDALLLGESGSAAPSGTSGTLTLTTPVALSELNLLDADGNGAANLTVTLNFANGGSDTITITAAMQDWFYGSNSAIIGYSRINRGSDAYDTTDGSNPNMYETDITVPVADQGDLVQSITFTQTGQAGGTTTTGIFAVSGLTVTATPAQYANNVSVTGNSTINVSNTATAAMGTLAIGSNTLAIASANTTGGAYSLTLGAATLSGNPTFNIANSSGGGPGTLILGAINDGGTARTITLTGGNLTLDSAATSLVQGTVVDITGGTLNSNNATALGSLATVNVGGNFGGSGTFAVGAGQTISALDTPGLVPTGTVSLASGAALTIGSTDNLPSNYIGSVVGGGSIIKAGSGTLTLNGASSTYSGGTTASTGMLISGNTSAIGTGPLTLNGGIVQLNSGSPFTYSGFGGNGASFGASGTANGWTVSSTAITSAAFPATNVLQLTDNGASEARTAFYDTAVPTNGNFVASFTFTPSGNKAADGVTFTLQDSTSGASALGAGGGDLGYTGITPSVALELNIYAGDGKGGVGAAFATNGAINTVTSLSPVSLAGGDPINVVLSYNLASTTLTATFTDADTGQTFTTSTSSINIASILGSSTAYMGFTGGDGGAYATQQISNFNYTIANSGTNSTYANNVVLNPGTNSTIDIAATSSVSNFTAGTLTVLAGAASTLNLTASTAPTGQAYGLTLGNVSLNSNLTVNVANNTNGSFNALGTLTLGAISDSGGGYGITTAGAGTVLLSGVNNYSGNTTVDSGSTLTVAATGALATASNLIDNGTVNLNSSSPSSTIAALNGSGTVNLNGSPLTVSGSGSFGGTIVDGSSSGSLTVSGGTLTLTNSNTYTGGTTISGGTLQLGDGATANGSVTGNILDNAALVFANFNPQSYGGVISGSGTVTESGPNVLTLTNANTYNGNTNVTGGTLTIGATGSIVSTAVTVYSGGTLSVAAGGSISSATNLTNNGIVDFNNPTLAIAALNGTDGSATLTLNGAALTVSGGGSYAGAIADGSSPGSLTVGGGTLNLSGANTYSGGTNVTGGALTIATGGSIAGPGISVSSGATMNVLSGGSISSATTLIDNGVVNFNNPTRTIATLNGTNGSAALNLNSTALTITGGGTFAGGIADGASPGSLIVSGGTLALNGGSSYSGGTTVSGGTLRVANASGTSATGTGPVAVNSGTLVGTGAANTGFLGGTVSIGNGAFIAPSGGSGTSATSNPVGTLTVGALTLVNGAELNYQVASYSSLDAITVSSTAAPNGTGNGTLILPSSGTATFNFYELDSMSPAVLAAGTYQLMAFGSVVGNTSNLSINSADLPLGDVPTFSSTGTALDLTIGSGITTGSGNWISNTGGGGGTDSNYSNSANWAPASGTNQYPNGPGQVATFGSGSQGTVTLSSTYTVGQLIFNGVGTASTTLGGTGGLLLNNSGNGPDVTVSAGAVYPYINVPLTLDDGSGKTTTFTVGAGSYLTMFGAIGETASSAQKILVTGGGTLELDGANTYTGSTTISAGSLLITAGASIKSSAISVAAGATLQLAGTTGALPTTANITTGGTGGPGDGAVTLTGTATETVGVISGTTGSGSVTTYAGNTTVGDGTNAANLTATQILQNTLTINAGSTVTIAPSGSGISMGEVVADASIVTSNAARSTATADGDSSSDPFTAIEAVIDSGSISSAKGEQLENRIAAIERMAATDPALDVSLLEDRVLAALPAIPVWSSSGTEPLIDSGSGLLAVDSSAFASSSGSTMGGATAAFAPAAEFGGSPAAVPEPSTLLLALLGGLGVALAARRRIVRENL